ncbi:UDP-N-acetylmuramoyl-L-alanine--D-glutamate ligase [Labedaea rhizosphaerae]|uniref:UDP-N-acetylmuramoylalanine--D-glutamate ligase n=1 Tax=Labedaea rhizosphaerae TaxID=598644 RepID=A0A4R6SCB5_LABRH|nr:UDP-N-acetylmuramoyl-L-alanine--D-glutamate ligase [Labedaea rhizosphaerae]TDP97223.1 UDP-N-acetylmuramoylalanine--D-glutamate ligase [Labedaea rhizosphaerae]
MRYDGVRVLVVGAGVTGKSVTPALTGLGAHVTVTDADPAKLAALEATGAHLAVGLDTPPAGTALVVTSPGLRPDHPLLTASAEQGIEVIGDVELAIRIALDQPNPPRLLAVTGTNGKTTTVTMLEQILRADGLDAVACGNVGLPVIDAVLAGHDVLAMELSSFQLHWQSSLRARAAAVLNLAEDHLDWHGTFAAYAADKGRIYHGAETRIANADDPATLELAGPGAITFTLGTPRVGQLGVVEDLLVDRAFVEDPVHGVEELATLGDLHVAGGHNVANALAAAALARANGASAGAVKAGLTAFRPGAHRAVPVGERDGVRFVDDSKATNPHAAAGSLTAHDHVVWIAGGLLKGAEVDDLVGAVADRLRGVVVLGRDAEVFTRSLARHAPEVPVHRLAPGEHDPMTAAVRAASAMARKGDVVLLAPAAASMDMFANYAQRGEAFTAAVRELLADTGSPGAR